MRSAPLHDGTCNCHDDGIDAHPLRPVLAGALLAVVVLAVGWFFPWRHFVDLSLLAVGIGSVAWRPGR
jgi:hypothetical protein